MNAVEKIQNLSDVQNLAAAASLVRQHFPAASVSLTPWRDDPETRRWLERETIDLAFHLPGWTPRLQCRSLLMQLQISPLKSDAPPHLLGVLMRGMAFDGERWRC